MIDPDEYTGTDIANARGAAMHALENHGWRRVEFAGLYQPVYTSPDGKRHVQLVRIIRTPRFELAPVAAPTPMIPPRRLDYLVERCPVCGDEIVNARLGHPKGEHVTLEPGYSGRGTLRLQRSIDSNDVPVMVAISDRSRGFGHVRHSATCRPSISKRLLGGTAA